MKRLVITFIALLISMCCMSQTGYGYATKKIEKNEKSMKKGKEFPFFEESYVATIDGQLIKLSASLNEVKSKKYKYAKFHALAFTDSLYAVESQGFLVNINSDFSKDSVYDFSFDNEERMIAIGNRIYFDSKYITLP